MRPLGVPTVADRIVQTVIRQVLDLIVEPLFHEYSYGYRLGKSAHRALAQTHRHKQARAQLLIDQLRERFAQCGLELHPKKTKVVYCKDSNRTSFVSLATHSGHGRRQGVDSP